MAKTLFDHGAKNRPEFVNNDRLIDWRKAMNNHVAYALLVYTVLQIIAMSSSLNGGGASMKPILMICVLIFGVIPICHRIDRRWSVLSDIEARDETLQPAFARDRLILWLFALVTPFAFTGLCTVIF